MFARRSFLAALAAAVTLPFLRRFPWPRKRKPCCDAGCGGKGESFAWEQHFQVPVWTSEETRTDDTQIMPRLAFYHALDILSSPASAEERLARQEQIKRINPDLHACLLRELNAIDKSVERVCVPDSEDGFAGMLRGYDPKVGTSFRFNYRQLAYRLDGKYYTGGATHLSISATEHFGKQGEGSSYWVDAPLEASKATRTLNRLAGPLHDMELAKQIAAFRNTINHVVCAI